MPIYKSNLFYWLFCRKIRFLFLHFVPLGRKEKKREEKKLTYTNNAYSRGKRKVMGRTLYNKDQNIHESIAQH